jgi:outer membrane PBP1 activator LpoA protein
MLFARRIARYATVAWIATLAGLLAGCPSLSTRTELPASVDRAQGFERLGDFASAAHVYEQLAAQNTGADRNAFALNAAHDWLAARRPDDAARALAMAQPPLSPQQNFDRQMLDVEVLIDRGQATLALQRLDSIPQPTTPTEAARYAALRQQATQASARQPNGPQQLLPEATPHLALLLPITGRNAAAGIIIRDGFMTAFYQAPVSQRPKIRIYDTGETGVGETLTHVVQEGAEFIVGPLIKDEITAAADYTARRPPILALNFLPAERPAPPNFYQFALSPEDEARQVARRILADGHKIGVAFAPRGDWGTRVLAAFSQELLAGGGTLLAESSYDPAITDYAEEITSTLRITESDARHKRLESILGTKLQFDPRRRGDIEFIFAAAQSANTERLLRPQLRFHHAGDVPTYATSSAFEPDPRANEDLEALMFPDMPWMLGGDLADAVHDVARAAWPNSASRRDRLFAFGFDAYRLAVALRDRPGGANINIDGLTGHLTLDADRHVRRELGWAQLKGGEVRLLPPPGTPAAAGTQAAAGTRPTAVKR